MRAITDRQPRVSGPPRAQQAHSARLRVLLLDDRYLSRRGMEIVLSAHDDIEVVGAADRSDGVADVAHLAPDVIILDHSPEAYRSVRKAAPQARILMLSARDAGADGLDVAPGDAPLDRTLSAEELASAVRRAARPAV